MNRAALCALLLALSAVAAQDVFIGGRVDLEPRSDRKVRANFGRDAGVDVTFSRPKVLDAYFDYSLAGGRGRVQELYVSPPQTRKVVTVIAGRFLLPYGDPRTNVVDRYVDGGRDLWDTYRGFRGGNVFLDTDVTGVQLSRSAGPVRLNLVGAFSPKDDACFQGRALIESHGVRAGGSVYLGRDAVHAPMSQAALHLGYLGHGVDAVGQLYAGKASGGHHRGWVARLSYRLPVAPVSLFAAQTLYHEDLLGGVSSTRFGAEWRIDSTYRLEGRYELNDAPAPNSHNRAVLRAVAVF